MKIKVRIISCKHESKYGTSVYSRIIKKNENVEDVIKDIQNACEYNEDAYGEYFDADIEEVILDTEDFEEV